MHLDEEIQNILHSPTPCFEFKNLSYLVSIYLFTYLTGVVRRTQEIFHLYDGGHHYMGKRNRA